MQLFASTPPDSGHKISINFEQLIDEENQETEKEMERNLLVFFALFLSFSASSCSAYFSGDADYLEALAIPPTDGARVYIVTVEWHKGLETRHFAIETLTSVLGRYALSLLF